MHTIQFVIIGDFVVPKRELKYLGVILDDRLSFRAHVRYITNKAIS